MFNEKIKELRKEKKINQSNMGKIVCLTQKQISNLETGRNEPDIKTIKEYCKYFNISADYLLDLIDEKKNLY